ncbi:MAG: hypothetical protein WC517_04965 [Patescibacteria group bacterium]
MFNQDLPVGNPETFLGECEVMDLSELKDKQFVVAINSGGRTDGKFICETIHGPYDFIEMVDEVAVMWKEHQHHSKCYVLSKDKNQPPQWLDECTCDYIEAKHVDIVTEAFMQGAFDPPEYTCRAGFGSAKEADPRLTPKTEEVPTEE